MRVEAEHLPLFGRTDIMHAMSSVHSLNQRRIYTEPFFENRIEYIPDILTLTCVHLHFLLFENGIEIILKIFSVFSTRKWN